MKRIGIGIAIVAAAIAVLYQATLAGAGFHCEACMHYEGRHACKAATAPTREEAERVAIATACALVSGGVTGTISCQATLPASLQCSER